MSEVDFDKLLGVNADEVERPVPLPAGSYIFTVIRHEMLTSKKKGTPGCQFLVQATAALEDVDEAALKEYGDLGKKQPKFKHDFWLTENSMFRLTDFLEHLGLDLTGRTIGEMLPETAAGEFVGMIEHSRSEDGQSVYANIGNTAPCDE